MKIMTLIGLILIVLGVVGLIYGGITYTSTKNVVDMGAVHLEVEQKRRDSFVTDFWSRCGGCWRHSTIRWTSKEDSYFRVLGFLRVRHIDKSSEWQ